MPTDYQVILADFHRDLTRTRDLLELVDGFREFASSARPRGVEAPGVWPEADTLIGLGPRVRTDLPVLAGSLLLYVCGRFENFVRRLVSERAAVVAAGASAYDDLPPNFRKALFEQSIEVAKSPAKFGLSKELGPSIIARFGVYIADPNAEAGAYSARELDFSVVSLTDSNMNSRMLTEILNRVCIDNVWTEAAKQARLKTYIGLMQDSSCRDAAIKRLDALMGERNSLAHPSGEAGFPGPERVVDACDFLEVLSAVVVDVVTMVEVAGA